MTWARLGDSAIGPRSKDSRGSILRQADMAGRSEFDLGLILDPTEAGTGSGFTTPVTTPTSGNEIDLNVGVTINNPQPPVQPGVVTPPATPTVRTGIPPTPMTGRQRSS